MTTELKRQYVRYAFYTVNSEWRRLSNDERDQHKAELAEVVNSFGSRFMLRTYSTVGTRPDVDFMLWAATEQLEDLHQLAVAISGTRLGAYLHSPYSYLAMTKRSMYVDTHAHDDQEGSRTQIRPPSTKYLFVYPFVKTRSWYRLSLEERQAMMMEHIQVGHKYQSIRIHTTYSFGL